MMRTDRTHEHGFVLVWIALMLTALLAIAALAIEWNHLSREGSRMQKAADASSLAGVIFMPDQLDAARARALDVAKQNGYVGGNGVTIKVEEGDEVGSLKVTITKVVPNLLGNVIGVGNQTISRSATAQFNTPLPMGSPGNHYANDPDLLVTNGGTIGDADGWYPMFWGQVAGGHSKWQGEVKMSKQCGNLTGYNQAADLCPSNQNSDYDEQGWIYEIKVRQAGLVHVQIFDPAWVNDLYCGNLNAASRASYGAAAALQPAQIPGYPDNLLGVTAPPANRYAPNSASAENPFCTGDNRVFWENPWKSGGQASPPLATTYKLHGPGTKFVDSPLMDGQGCTAQFPGIARTDHGQAQLPIDQLLTGAAPITDYIDSNYHTVPAGLPPFGAYYRAWWELCTFDAPGPGTYYLQVQTLKDVAGNPVPGVDDVVATNHFSVRAYNSDVAPVPGVDSTTTVAGWGMMNAGVWAARNSSLGSDAEFYLLRLEPAAHERRLVISAFDLGDFTCNSPNPNDCIGGSGAELTVLPPKESFPAVFNDCTYTDPVGRDPVDARPLPFVEDIDGCKMTNVGTPFAASGNGTWSGKWVDIVITVPKSYTCDVVDPKGCWLRLHYKYNPDLRLHDGLAITASVEGDPVRLVR